MGARQANAKEHTPAASHVAWAGQEVHAFEWGMNDADPLAAAGCASNALTWDLGPNVLVGCSDVLVTPEWPSRACLERAQIRARHAREVADARMLAGLRLLMAGPTPTAGQASPPPNRGIDSIRCIYYE
ncbi:hypothetical protein ACWD4F_23175 [Streptomyces aureus]